MNTLTPKPLSDDELMDKLLFAGLKDGEQVFICDWCGAWSKQSAKSIRHESHCPDAGVSRGD